MCTYVSVLNRIVLGLRFISHCYFIAGGGGVPLFLLHKGTFFYWNALNGEYTVSYIWILAHSYPKMPYRDPNMPAPLFVSGTALGAARNSIPYARKFVRSELPYKETPA